MYMYKEKFTIEEALEARKTSPDVVFVVQDKFIGLYGTKVSCILLPGENIASAMSEDILFDKVISEHQNVFVYDGPMSDFYRKPIQ